MPNHVTNVIIMKNITKLPFFSDYEKSEKAQKIFFDFNKIIPMPEELQIESGSIESIAVEMAIRFYEKNGEGFEEYHRYSNEDFEKMRSIYSQSDIELADIGLKYLSNSVHYQASNWYVWCCKNWGTKWNSYELNIINKDCIQFKTAWNPPVPVLMMLSSMNPKTKICHYYCDEYIGNGSGLIEYQDGVIVNDETADKEDFHHPSKYTEIAFDIDETWFSYDKKLDMNILIYEEINAMNKSA